MYSNEELGSDSPLNMKETDPAIIERQIAEGIGPNGETLGQFLNNFETVLPGGLARKVADEMGMQDTAFIKEDKFDLHSERAKQITYREFFEDVDGVVAKAGISVTLQGLRKDQETGSAGVPLKILELAIPVYKMLRVSGYSHYDLWQ